MPEKHPHMSPILEVIPSMYRNLVPEDLVDSVSPETNATCHDCAMCSPSARLAQPVQQELTYFKPNLKCCTFHPQLPNYAVGGILSDASEELLEGRERIKKKITERNGVYPHGIDASKLYSLLYSKVRPQFRMGLAESLLCPYFRKADGKCTVWSYREAVCSTWFCKHVRGQAGRDFWTAMKNYLLELETVLSAYAMVESGFRATETTFNRYNSEIELLDDRDVDGRPPDRLTYARRWGNWAGRETDFFCAAYDLVSSLTRKDVTRLGGLKLERLELTVKERHRQMEKPIVSKGLRPNPELRSTKESDGRYRLIAYSGYDPIRVSSEVHNLLEFFDGRKLTDHVLDEIGEKLGVILSQELLDRLCQYGVLVGSDAYSQEDAPWIETDERSSEKNGSQVSS